MYSAIHKAGFPALPGIIPMEQKCPLTVNGSCQQEHHILGNVSQMKGSVFENEGGGLHDMI